MAYTLDETYWKNFTEPGGKEQGIVGADLASAATMAPTHRIHYVSGTTEITAITLPYAGFAGTITFIPEGAFTTNTGGATGVAISKAETAIALAPVHFTYHPAKGLWYPSLQGTA